MIPTNAEMHIPPSGILLILGGTAFLLKAANFLSVAMDEPALKVWSSCFFSR